jgi:hypothetical protein
MAMDSKWPRPSGCRDYKADHATQKFDLSSTFTLHRNGFCMTREAARERQ